MLTDLVQIRRLGARKEKENKRFRAYLKKQAPKRRLRELAEEIHEQIDCRTCANCCREGEAAVTPRDVEKLANLFRLSREDFRARFTMRGIDNDLILKRTDEEGCIFLKDNLCTVYEARPISCSGYPHLKDRSISFERRMITMPERATYCPIVYNWAEAAKKETGFR